MLRFTGAATSSSSGALNETSRPTELLVLLEREHRGTLGAQIEDQLRGAIRSGALREASPVPSTRDLARQLGVSRRVVVDAYAQLAAEGYLVVRQGARPRVAAVTEAGASAPVVPTPATPGPRYDFRPSMPDVSAFPRRAWLRCVRDALAGMSDADLGYGDMRGVEDLRRALAGQLGRVRGVITEPERLVITSGFSQAVDLVFRALRERGARRVAFEDPGYDEPRAIAARAGLEAVAVPVDEHGLQVDALARTDADAVVLTPAHQHPTGVALSGERRTALLAWLRGGRRLAIEDDYDADYRYDRAAVGALQGLDPERVAYAGSASKTLAPALRLGWVALPADLLDDVVAGKALADRGTDRITQFAFARLLERGDLDRHRRRMLATYRERRDAIVAALAEELPDCPVRGIAAGLHASVELRPDDDEAAILAELERRRVALATTAHHRMTAAAGPPVLLVGYGQVALPAIRPGVRAIGEAVRAARART